jgi:hypothetical protein
MLWLPLPASALTATVTGDGLIRNQARASLLASGSSERWTLPSFSFSAGCILPALPVLLKTDDKGAEGELEVLELQRCWCFQKPMTGMNLSSLKRSEAVLLLGLRVR